MLKNFIKIVIFVKMANFKRKKYKFANLFHFLVEIYLTSSGFHLLIKKLKNLKKFLKTLKKKKKKKKKFITISSVFMLV